MEINPNHPVSRMMRDQWHKVVALLMTKQRVNEVVITPDDIRALPADPAIAVHEQADGLHIILLDGAVAERLARREGGLPV